MCIVVHPLKLSCRDLRVSLRRRKALVAEQFLNRPKVGAFFQQVGAERMPKRVRMNVRRQPAEHGGALHYAADTSRGQASFAAGLVEAAKLEVDEQRRCRP